MRAVFQAQGRLMQMKRRGLPSSPPPGGGKRGGITAFSKASRRRLIHLAARLDPAGTSPKFLTLTFKCAPTPSEAKAAFKRFTMRLRRNTPAASAVWRLELQARGAIHFHLIVFNMPFVPQKRLQEVWTECTREERSIVDIRAVKGGRRVMSYMSKYLAKIERGEGSSSLDTDAYQHAPIPEGVGRWWGYINEEGLPFASIEEEVCEDAEVVYYFQFAVRSLSRGKAGHAPTTATLFDDDPYAMLAWIRRHSRIPAPPPGDALPHLEQE